MNRRQHPRRRRAFAAVVSLVAGAAVIVTTAPGVDAAAGYITRVAGTGTASYSGDGGAATSATLNHPIGVTVDSAGNVFIADLFNHRVRKVNAAGTISTVAGTGTAGSSGDGGPATSAQLSSPASVAVDSGGNLYISESGGHRIRKVSTTGTISTVAGTGTAAFSGDGGPATSAQLSTPRQIALDSAGNLFIADHVNERVRKVTTTGTISTVAGTGSAGFSGDGGPATSAQLNRPWGIALDSSGNLWIGEEGNDRIRKVSTAGTISTVAGTGTSGFSGDGGAATSAQIADPREVAVDATGNVFVADHTNHRIRRISPTGTMSTVAGTGTPGSSGDGGPAVSATLNQPSGVGVDSAGTLFIGDMESEAVRKVVSPTTPTTTTTTTTTTTSTPTTTTTTPTTTTSTSTTTTVPIPVSYPSDDCASGSNVVTGWFQNVYSSVRTATSGSATMACIALEQGATHLGGRLTVGTAVPTTPNVDDSQGACADTSLSGEYHLIRDLSVLGRPFRLEAKLRPTAAAPTEVWLCVRADTVAKRLVVPTTVGGLPTFLADGTARHSPAYPATPGPAGKPSSTCQAVGGQSGRVYNVQVADSPAWLYTWQESATRTHVCVRVGSGSTDGGRLTVDSAGGVNVIATDASSNRGPCPQQVLDDVGPPPFWIYTSPTGATPAWACVKVGTTFARVKVDTAGGQGIATFTRDS